MSLQLDAVKVILYDLDGTIYDDNRHFDLYAREIQSYLHPKKQRPFWADYTAVVKGEHPALRLGTFYDVKEDLVLYPRGGRVVRACQWDGSQTPPLKRELLYPAEVRADHTLILNVGDMWWVPLAISAHYGGIAVNHGKAFLKIRALMSDPAFVIEPIPGLKERIAAMQGKVIQVLATNSPQPDSEAILTKVGLLELFDRTYFQCNKPMGLRTILAELAADCQVAPEAILSIGDNLVNEIAPARAMGAQTAFIDLHKLADSGEADQVVRAMPDLFSCFDFLASR